MPVLTDQRRAGAIRRYGMEIYQAAPVPWREP